MTGINNVLLKNRYIYIYIYFFFFFFFFETEFHYIAQSSPELSIPVLQAQMLGIQA
jgi:hypothetical protein